MSLTSSDSQASELAHERSSFLDALERCPRSSDVVPDGYSVEVITNIRDIDVLRQAWNQWAQSPDADFDYYLHRLKHDPTVLGPYIIAARNDGIQALLAGHLKRQRASALISFVNIPGPNARVLEIKNGGRMGRPSPVIDRLFAQQLLRSAKAGDVDSVCIERLPLHSSLFREIQNLSSFWVKGRVRRVFRYSSLPLATNGAKPGRLFSGKVEREIRRKTRILERAFPDQVHLRCFADLNELETGVRDVMRIAVATWQHYLGMGPADTAEVRDVLRFFAERGWLRIYVLYVDGIPTAFLIGQLYKNSFFCQHAGYHPSYIRFSVGSVLTARALEDLAAAGVQHVDLGEGGEEHNRRLGSGKSEQGTVHIYSHTLRGFGMNLFFGAAKMIGAGASKTRSGLHLNWLAKTRRSLLFSRGTSHEPHSQRPANLF